MIASNSHQQKVRAIIKSVNDVDARLGMSSAARDFDVIRQYLGMAFSKLQLMDYIDSQSEKDALLSVLHTLRDKELSYLQQYADYNE